MSDDEYFDNDEIFNSAELDNIPALNEPSTSHAAAPPASPPAAQPSSSHIPPQPTAGQPQSSRLSAIMNALKKSAESQPQAGPSNVSTTSKVPKRESHFGPYSGLSSGMLYEAGGKSGRRKREDSSSGSESPNSSRSPRKRTRRGRLGLKQHQSSPNGAALKEIAQLSKAEGVVQGEGNVWAIIEEELQCAICCDVLVVPQITPCGHTACAGCLAAWLKAKPNCPMCRTHLSSSQKPTDNLICANLIDRMFKESSEWHPGQPKRIEWTKRKQDWDKEVANSRPRRYVPARAPAPAPQRPQRPLFNPDPDSGDDDGEFDSDSGNGHGSDIDEADENFQLELLNELARQGALRFRIYD